METISQEERQQLAGQGAIAGEKKPSKVLSLKAPSKIKEQAPVTPDVTHTENHVHVDLSPLEKSQRHIEQVLEQNAELIKALSVHLKSMNINNIQEEKVDKKVVFTVKRDQRGLIESIEVGDA